MDGRTWNFRCAPGNRDSRFVTSRAAPSGISFRPPWALAGLAPQSLLHLRTQSPAGALAAPGHIGREGLSRSWRRREAPWQPVSRPDGILALVRAGAGDAKKGAGASSATAKGAESHPRGCCASDRSANVPLGSSASERVVGADLPIRGLRASQRGSTAEGERQMKPREWHASASLLALISLFLLGACANLQAQAPAARTDAGAAAQRDPAEPPRGQACSQTIAAAGEPDLALARSTKRECAA